MNQDNVTKLPITRIPAPTGDPFLDRIEVAILAALSEWVEFDREALMHQAFGMAIGRTYYLQERFGKNPTHGEFITAAMTVVRRMSARQRTKLRHPARNRQECQRLVEGESI